MSNLQERAGSVMVRVGGNTQEQAQLVPSTPDGRILEKDKAGSFNPVSKLRLMSAPTCAHHISDKYPTIDIYPRTALHAEERFLPSQCSVVPWCAAPLPLLRAPDPLTLLMQVCRSSTSPHHNWQSSRLAKPS